LQKFKDFLGAGEGGASDVNKDWMCKDKDKDQAYKDQDKDQGLDSQRQGLHLQRPIKTCS